MSKSKFRCYLDQALLVLVIMASATLSAVFDVRAVSAAMAAGKLGLGTATGVAASAPPRAPVAAASAAAEAHGARVGTVVARLSR